MPRTANRLTPMTRAEQRPTSGEFRSAPRWSTVGLIRQVQSAWDREGEPAEGGFRLARPIIVLCGLASLLLLAIATLTILSLDSLWQYHEAAGFALLPVLTVKLVPIGIRAAGYYRRTLAGRLRGRPAHAGITPPVPLARLSAPPLVIAAALLLGSGIVMWHTGDQRSAWSTVHNASAVIGGILVGVHLVCHSRSTLAVAARRLAAPGETATGGVIPPTVAGVALVAGIVLAALTVPGASWNPGRGDRHAVPGSPQQSTVVVVGQPPRPTTPPASRGHASTGATLNVRWVDLHELP